MILNIYYAGILFFLIGRLCTPPSFRPFPFPKPRFRPEEKNIYESVIKLLKKNTHRQKRRWSQKEISNIKNKPM